ncbi:MAG: peptidoglycan-binding domain-containing protein [Thermoanaerobaculia bacterium]
MSKRTVKLGDRGARVRRLQEALVEAGLSRLAVDGSFGRPTEAALRKFQVAVGLPSTGVLDTRTAASLAKLPPSEAPPLLYRNPANPHQRHLLPDDRPPGRRGGS